MVRVVGGRGKFVDIHMTGMSMVMHRLRSAQKEVESSADLGVIKAGGHVQEEVKESIAGRRAEPKSVDTGLLGNSIVVNKIKKAEVKVEPRGDTYPGTSTTTKEVATHLEYGTSKINPRRHFRNTEARTKGEVKGIIQKEIKIGKI